MCGIAGIIRKPGDRVDREAILKAANLLRRRGPDDQGFWIRENVGFGHRRLAIIDTSQGGKQPMVTPDGRFVLVFNGELYNYKELRNEIGDFYSWQGESDSEVVLAAYVRWGPDCLLRFHGMFAFTIWDERERRLFGARDRMGVKPFYYHNGPKAFTFASRPRALFTLLPAISTEFDWQGLRFYLEGGYFPGHHSVYGAVRKLPPAHYFELREGEFVLRRYWDFRGSEPDQAWAQRDEDELVDELDAILARSVHSRLVSDVPLGAFLSGGIDSSLVVALMTRHSSGPVKTFTIAFDETKLDESGHAQTVASYLGTDHFCEHLKIDGLLELIPLFAEEYDEPFFDSSAFPAMAVSRLARKHVKVALSGDGGDELFGGYHYYRIAQAFGAFFQLPQWCRYSISLSAAAFPTHKMKLIAGALRHASADAAFAFIRSISKDFEGLLLPEASAHTESLYQLFARVGLDFPKPLSTAERGMRLDTLYTLPDEYLQKVDLASMSFSLEAREPLLDQDLVEWSMRLPMTWKLRRGVNKYLLRRLAYRYIPRRILDRPKQGFEVPMDRWLRGPLSDWAMNLLHEKALFQRLPISQKRALELFSLHKSRRRNVAPLLWAVLMLLNFVAFNTNNSNQGG